MSPETQSLATMDSLSSRKRQCPPEFGEVWCDANRVNRREMVEEGGSAATEVLNRCDELPLRVPGATEHKQRMSMRFIHGGPTFCRW